MSTVAVDPRIRARRIAVARDAGRRRLRRVLVLAGFAGLGLLALAATWTPLLDVEAVAVSGAERTSQEAVLEAAGVHPGDALAWFDPGDAARRVEALPWVDEATVHRTWSGEVGIEVSERVAVAAVAGPEGAWLLADADGRLLARLEAVPTDLPVVESTTAPGGPGDQLASEATGPLTVAAAVPVELRPEVASVRAGGGEVEVVLRAGGVIVLGGPDGAAGKLSAAAAVLSTVPARCVEHLDVGLPAAPALVRVPGCT